MLLNPTELSPLLTDATLLAVRRAPAGLTLVLNCPRRGPRGEPLPPVELTVFEVGALAVSYDGAHVDTRPSALTVPAEARVQGLVPWALGGEVEFQINSAHEDEDLALAAQVDWLEGEPAVYGQATVRLRIQPAARPAWPDLTVGVWVGALALAARLGGGAHLSLARWQREHDAWWLHWADHWDEDPALASLDRLHPVPLRHGCPDLTYRPPAAPAFVATGTSDCPAALLAPLEAWHEGLLGRDWLRMARAFPHLDQVPRRRADCLRSECLGAGFGRWGYAHAVEGWWVEGARAGVTVRGVEHVLGLDGAEDRPVVWRYGLRRRGGAWTIHGFRTVDVEDEADAVPLSACS